MRVLQFIGVCVAALAVCGCDQGQPMPPDQPASFKPGVDVAAAKKAAESGNALAQTNLGLMYYNGQGVPQDYAEAMKWFRLAADQGDATAQFNLGLMYYKGYNGQGVPQDYAEAMKWYRLAADQGDALAQTNLGLMYYKGKGVPPDYAEAYLWSLVAAASGYAVAAELLDPFASKLTPDQVAAAKKRAADLLKKIESGK